MGKQNPNLTGKGHYKKHPHFGTGYRKTPEQKSAEEGSFNDEQFEFVMAMDKFKKTNNKRFPSWTDALCVLKSLGWTKQKGK